jgi:DNA modification methylase
VELVAAMIRNSSRTASVVLDPFLGSGSTLIACEQLGRRCYGAEIDPRYVDVVIRRWETLTGEEAKRE